MGSSQVEATADGVSFTEDPPNRHVSASATESFLSVDMVLPEDMSPRPRFFLSPKPPAVQGHQYKGGPDAFDSGHCFSRAPDPHPIEGQELLSNGLNFVLSPRWQLKMYEVKVKAGVFVVVVVVVSLAVVFCHESAPNHARSADQEGSSSYLDGEPSFLPRSIVGSSLATPRTVFNVRNEGAVGDGIANDTKAFLASWTKACKVPNAVVLVPSRYKFLVYPSTYSGPCQPDFHFQVEGTILAPKEISAWDGLNVANWILFQNLNNFTLLGQGTFDGRGQNWWACKENGTCPKCPTAVTIYKSSNVTARSITLVNSPQIHINFQRVNGGLAKYIQVQAPWWSPNTDGIHIGYTTNFSVQRCNVSTGDDCVSIVTGSHNIAVQNTYCGLGCHGISVGSLGANGEHANVSQVLVKNCHLESTTNGLRIKTWQGGTGIASNFEFRNVKLTNVSNPIIIDQYYCPPTQTFGPCQDQTGAVAIDLVKFINITGTSASRTAVVLECSESHSCTNIHMKNINITLLSSGKVPGAACVNAFGVVQGAQSPPNCLSHPSLAANFKPLTFYLPNFNAVKRELQGIFIL